MQKFAPHYEFVGGGKTRQISLKNALKIVRSEFVMVSDCARVCVSKELFNRLILNAKNADCVTPILKVADTVLHNEKPIDRDFVKLVQTPQLSRTALLRQALSSKAEFTDDSTAIASLGGKIWYVQGEENARKITFKEDLKKLDLPAPAGEIFCGNGFDVHEFGQSRALILGGVKVHENMGVRAHSDGDVIAHAVMDALLGACSLGDIGEIYPDTSPKFKDANSMELLQSVYKKVLELGYECVNMDISVIAQAPKLGVFKAQIAENIAKTLNLTPFRVNVKATTTENLGFIGRKEGIAVFASVNLRYFDWVRWA